MDNMDFYYNLPSNNGICDFGISLEWVLIINEMFRNYDFNSLESEIYAASFGRSGVAIDDSNYNKHYYSFGER